MYYITTSICHYELEEVENVARVILKHCRYIPTPAQHEALRTLQVGEKMVFKNIINNEEVIVERR